MAHEQRKPLPPPVKPRTVGTPEMNGKKGPKSFAACSTMHESFTLPQRAPQSLITSPRAQTLHNPEKKRKNTDGGKERAKKSLFSSLRSPRGKKASNDFVLSSPSIQMVPKPSNTPQSPSERLSTIELIPQQSQEVILSKDPRENVVRELYDTEKGYVRDLTIIVEMFLIPLRESNLVATEDINKIFNTVELLLPLHKDLLEQLTKSSSVSSLEKTSSDPNFSIGRCFVNISQYLKMYNQYCSNQQSSMTVYNQLIKHNKPFEELMNEISHKPECKRLDLPSYLIKPMQRVCKYPLLLREIIKQTPESHLDYSHLQQAISLISATVGVINNSKREFEEGETVLQIQEKITYPKNLSAATCPIVAPGRKYLESGQCIYISKNTYASSTVKWILFNDLLVITQRGQLKKYVPVDSALIGYVSLQGEEHAFEIIQAGKDKIWLAKKTAVESQELQRKFVDVGMMKNDAPMPCKLQDYANRPIPIPPGKFSQSFDAKQDINEVMQKLETMFQPKQELPALPIIPQVVTKKQKEAFFISSPTLFRKPK